jgi:hypothetical protein
VKSLLINSPFAPVPSQTYNAHIQEALKSEQKMKSNLINHNVKLGKVYVLIAYTMVILFLTGCTLFPAAKPTVYSTYPDYFGDVSKVYSGYCN